MYKEARPEEVIIVKGSLANNEGEFVSDANVSIHYDETGQKQEVKVNQEDGSYAAAVKVNDAKSISIVKEAQDKRAYIMKKANYLRDQLKSNNIPYIDSNSHIVPIMAYKSQLAKLYSKKLLEKFHIYVQPIFYPTVPKNAARLRITITPKHSKNDINELITALISIYQSSAKKKPRKLFSKTLKRTPVYT